MGEKQRFDYWVYRFDETDMRSSEQMQDAINDFALKGWRLVTVAAPRVALFAFFERPHDE